MRHYTIQEAAERTGVAVSTLRTWETRFGWPLAVRKANGYRLFSEATLSLVRDFLEAGKPFHQLRDGLWDRCSDNIAPIARTATPILIASDDLEQGFISALNDRHLGRVAFYLASLGRMRPPVRAQYVRAVQEANQQTGGAFAKVMRAYQIEEQP